MVDRQKIIQTIGEKFGWDAGSIWVVHTPSHTLRSICYWQSSAINNTIFEVSTKNLIIKSGEGLPGSTWKNKDTIWVNDIKNEKRFIRGNEAKKAGIECALFVPLLTQNDVVGVIELFARKKGKSEAEILNLMKSIGPQIAQFIQRKWAENELRASETYKTAILESALDSIITIDEHGKIISCNPQTTKIFGYISEELINQNIHVLMPDIDTTISSLVGKTSIEYTAVRKDKALFPTEISISKMYIAKQYIYVIIIRDITERKKIDKMKNEFVSVVSHELRTPITSIRGSLGLLLGGVVGELSEKATKLVEIANNNCDRLLTLVNELLDVGKIEAGKMEFKLEITDLEEIIKQSIYDNSMFAAKFGIKIQLEGTIPQVKIHIDKNRIAQVLTNLISNAAKFSPQGGTITVTVSEMNNRIRVAVSDKGSGIPDAFKNKIFQRFSQADSSDKRNKSGTGLGLNISKTIIEKLGGTLDFTSEVNKGTTFYFELPVWNGQDDSVIVIDNVDDSKLQNKILICDNDEDLSKYMGAILESRGFTVDLSFNAASARKYLANNDYKAVLLDLILPDEDGISFIRELRIAPKTSNLPIIVISVISETGKSLLNGDAFCVIDWLDKPVDFNRLIKTISHIKKDYSIELPRILHVEDDIDTQMMIKTLLEGRAIVISAGCLSDAKSIMSEQPFDFVILDLLLPDGNGIELIPIFADMKLPIIIYSSGELDSQYSCYVHETLTKSKTTNEKLVNTILKLLKTDKEFSNE